jgi:hypothetical protein
MGLEKPRTKIFYTSCIVIMKVNLWHPLRIRLYVASRTAWNWTRMYRVLVGKPQKTYKIFSQYGSIHLCYVDVDVAKSLLEELMYLSSARL